MKNLLPKVTCLMCLTATSLSNAQSTNNSEKPLINDPTVTSGLLVCKLTGPAFKKRLDELRTVVFSKVESYSEEENGYTFHFKDEGDFLQKLTDYMLSERKCCAFFDFNLTIKANEGGAILTISGPEGAKKMIELMIDG